MRSLVQYIFEEENITKIQDMTVIFKVLPEKITIALPANYSESDMQIYLDDICLDDFPGSNKESKKLLGKNVDNIQDAYFEYSKFTTTNKPEDTITLKWDPKYDTNNSEDKFVYYTIEELKYKLEFSEFNLKNVENIKEELMKIFSTFNSNETNEYPLDIELEDIEYDE